MVNLNKADLKNFLFEAGRATYASGDESVKQKQSDGSTTIVYKSGEYSYHDNYFGGEPYGGREVVFFNEKPLWMMAYYGLVYGGVNKEVYGFLMDSLLHATPEMPYRGPALYEKDVWKYINTFAGDVEHFSGTEKIFKDDVCVYEASYLGGLVDQ